MNPARGWKVSELDEATPQELLGALMDNAWATESKAAWRDGERLVRELLRRMGTSADAETTAKILRGDLRPTT